MKDLNIVFAGFGGQGILFAGKVVAYAGLIEGRELSWLPSYGPEMRGGTANCSICLSDEPIGSPLVTNPNVLIAMNRPSLDKFVNEVEPGRHDLTRQQPHRRACRARRRDRFLCPGIKTGGGKRTERPCEHHLGRQAAQRACVLHGRNAR